ncbi:MAG: Serine/threonine-protein kinase PknB [Planctomycetota bacterium]
MNLAIDKFVQQLEDSGILAGETIEDFIPPKGRLKDSAELAHELVRQNKLTSFQVQELEKGNGKSLILGNYVLLEKIGAGGMGEVYKAKHRRMDRIVALKLLPASMMKDPTAITRFAREVKAAAMISHPNIVSAFDADQANGVHFLVMEFVEGSDLSTLIKKHGPISVDKAVSYCIQVAKGLEASHKRGVIHRDIKPANLLLDKEGTVKILDLGLARIESPPKDKTTDATQTELTHNGAVMGTFDYMSPEQALNSKDADARADIYSLGCTLFYLIAGRTTYGGDTVIEKVLAHREKPIPSIKDLQTGIPPQLERVFQKMVAKHPDDRYPNMTQLLADLEKCIPGDESTLVLPELVNPERTISLKHSKDFGSVHALKPELQTGSRLGNGIRKPIVLLGACILGVLSLLAGIIITLKTKDGTLVVSVDEPDAEVQVLNADGKIEISRKGEKGIISVSIDPGKHRLKIQKDGFMVYGENFEIGAGGKIIIAAKLVPLDEQPAGEKMNSSIENVSAADMSKRKLFFNSPGFGEWAKQVASLTPTEQVEAVTKKLIELNPLFNGKIVSVIDGNVVNALTFWTDQVIDISPVRSLSELKVLICAAEKSSELNDLTPLIGLKLIQFDCSRTKVTDLTPLKEMALTNLCFDFTPVEDISPLKGMNIEIMGCTCTSISTLDPLKEMNLSELFCGGTKVTDLSPLAGMALVKFYCDSTDVKDLSPISKAPLRELSFNKLTPERDADLIRSIKTLEVLNQRPVHEFLNAIEILK